MAAALAHAPRWRWSSRLEIICRYATAVMHHCDAQQEITARQRVCMRAWACIGMADPRARRTGSSISTAHAPSARAEAAGSPHVQQGAQEEERVCVGVCCVCVGGLPACTHVRGRPPACAVFDVGDADSRHAHSELMNERNGSNFNTNKITLCPTALLGALRPHKNSSTTPTQAQASCLTACHHYCVIQLRQRVA